MAENIPHNVQIQSMMQRSTLVFKRQKGSTNSAAADSLQEVDSTKDTWHFTNEFRLAGKEIIMSK